jgi:hypothetical protein
MRVPVPTFLVLATVAAGAPAADNLQPAQMQGDLRVLQNALEEAHGGLYRYSSHADHEKRLERARSLVSRPMPTLAFAAILSETLAGVRDGHMRLEYDNATAAALAAARLLPLRVAYEERGLVVMYNDSPADSSIRPGMRLISVNGKPAADIIATILPKISGDGFIEAGKTFRMGRNFAQYYWMFVEQAANFTVTAKTAAGTGVKAQLAGITNEERAPKLAKLDGSREMVSLHFPVNDVGVLRVRGFDGESFPASLATAFATLREKNARALVLDLRGNGGGVDMYGALLVSQFVRSPFRYFDHIKVASIHPSFATWKSKTFDDLKEGTQPVPDGGFLVLPSLHPGVGEQAPSAAPFSGRLFVLVDGGTFSTAADVCAQLRSLTKATFLGEETGGAAEGNTSGLNAQIVLPSSGLKLKIQMYGYWNAVQGGQRGRGTMPDVPIPFRSAEVLAGTDVALNRALALAREAR